MNKLDYDKKIALIGMGGVLLAFILLVLGLKTYSSVLIIIGVVVFFLTVLGATVIANIVNSASDAKLAKDRASYRAKVTTKYQPLLADERTKQHPDVQRLLQYLTVQKAFFNPGYIYSMEAQNDPHVRELMSILDSMLDGGGINGDFGGYGNVDPNSAYVSELNRRELLQHERKQKRPRSIAGSIMVGVGVALFMLPFISAFFNVFGKNLVFVMGAAPIGMLLIVVGKIIKK